MLAGACMNAFSCPFDSALRALEAALRARNKPFSQLTCARKILKEGCACNLFRALAGVEDFVRRQRRDSTRYRMRKWLRTARKKKNRKKAESTVWNSISSASPLPMLPNMAVITSCMCPVRTSPPTTSAWRTER